MYCVSWLFYFFSCSYHNKAVVTGPCDLFWKNLYKFQSTILNTDRVYIVQHQSGPRPWMGKCCFLMSLTQTAFLKDIFLFKGLTGPFLFTLKRGENIMLFFFNVTASSRFNSSNLPDSSESRCLNSCLTTMEKKQNRCCREWKW